MKGLVTMNILDITGYLVHKTDVKITNFFIRQLKPFGITPEQWGIICVLQKDKKTNQKELSKTIDRDQTTVVRMVNNLQSKGIIKKVINDTDKRSHFITLTNQGEELKLKLIPIVQQAHETVTNGFTKEQLETLHNLLNQLYDNANRNS